MAIKYKWLAGTLRDLIKKDIKNEINKLPSEQELCSRYHVSRQTVRQALNLLTQEGLIEKTSRKRQLYYRTFCKSF